MGVPKRDPNTPPLEIVNVPIDEVEGKEEEEED